MVREKIKTWLQKCGIETEISPAITLFGIITFSVARIRADPNPDKWGEKQKQEIADILDKGLKISLKEFSEYLKEETKEKTRKEIEIEIKNIHESFKNEIEKIVKSIIETPVITLEEFKKRNEIRPLLKYKKFIGRDEELSELHNFLTVNTNKIMFIVGEGGIGKTRLAIEFGEQAKDKNWDVYFIHRFKDFRSIRNTGKILLILDDTSRYPDRIRLIDFVQNPPSGDLDIKLLLFDRPIFKGSVESDLRENEISTRTIEIKKGDIITFLKQNFEEIEEDIIIQIDRLCENSFIYAAFYAEYYKEAFMTLRVTHENENENKLVATDHSIMFKRVSIST